MLERVSDTYPARPGKAAVKALTSPAYAKLKNVPKVASEEEATQLLLSIIPFAFFLRVEHLERLNSWLPRTIRRPGRGPARAVPRRWRRVK